MTSVERANDKVLHTSDIQGPMSRQTTQAVMKHKPSLVILGGPPTYLEGIKVEEASIKKGIDNAARLVDRVSVLILDHHLLRSENWKDRAAPIFDVARSAKHSVMTAAEYMGSSPILLESMRERLYEKDPPSEEFIKWTKRPREKRRLEDPPV